MTIKTATIKSIKSLWNIFPLILGTIFLVSLLSTIIPTSFYTTIFSQSTILDSFIGSILGSISVGNPIISYVLGGELLKEGVSLLAVTSFLVAWVTVGIVQLPAESIILTKKFALLRNFSSFILSILVAIITILILTIIS